MAWGLPARSPVCMGSRSGRRVGGFTSQVRVRNKMGRLAQRYVYSGEGIYSIAKECLGETTMIRSFRHFGVAVALVAFGVFLAPQTHAQTLSIDLPAQSLESSLRAIS